LALIPNHARLLRERLPLQFHKTRILALVDAFALGVQCMEADIFGVWLSTQLGNASGDGLDQWGALVGEARGGLGDTEYRVFIDAKLLVLIFKGTLDETIEIFRRITAPSISIRADPVTAGIVLWVLREEPMSDERARRVSEFMRQAHPGGVQIALVESTPGYFGFIDDPGHPGVPEDAGESFGFDEGQYSRVL
jgi:hypothetical protein